MKSIVNLKPVLKLWKRGEFLFFLDKRHRFALQTIILTAGLLITQLIWADARFIMVLVLSILTYILTSWSLSEDIKGVEWFILFVLPVLFTASVSLFYFLLPGRWIIRLSIIVIFAIGSYAILLVENIYNVAAERSIQLVRAAHSIGLLVSLVVIFLFANIIYSLRFPFWLNMLFFIPLSFVLSLQSLWSIKLETVLSKNLLIYAGVISLGMGELAVVLSFWPIANAPYSLLFTASYYSLIGVVQLHFLDRLFKDAVREYVWVLVFTLVLIFLITRWG